MTVEIDTQIVLSACPRSRCFKKIESHQRFLAIFGMNYPMTGVVRDVTYDKFGNAIYQVEFFHATIDMTGSIHQDENVDFLTL